MGVKQEVAEEQARALAEDGVSEETARITTGIYEAVDAMSSGQRRILVEDVLSGTVQMTTRVVEEHGELSQADLISFAMLTSTLCAVAGYANALEREEQEETATGDKTVVTVMKDCHALIKSMMVASLAPADRERLQKVEEQAREMVEQGASVEEAKAFLKESVGADFDVEVEVEIQKKAETEPEPAPVYTGMYL